MLFFYEVHMKFLYSTFKTFTKFELSLWLGSLALILSAFFLSGNGDRLTLAASLIGGTALILVSKGNVLGQLLTVVFSVLYGIISYTFRYYGEMITYLGMTAPIAIASVVTWLRHAHGGNKTEVRINTLRPSEYLLSLLAGIAIMCGFYFILKAFDTNYLPLSTFSVLTSFLASYLTMRRSPYYALAYAANDLVLISLWTLASLSDPGYLPMIVCFLVFLVNDVYGFARWSRAEKRQAKEIKDIPAA